MTARAGAVAIAALLAATAPAGAEVVSADASGFAVRAVLTIAAPPEAVYAALLAPSRWWDPAHSWSGDAANIRLEPAIGGCFCEKLPKTGGEAAHMRVIAIDPNHMIRLDGALGPFQAMGVAGTLSWELKPVAGGTEFRQTYAVGGHIPGGGAALAPVVDGVMGGQAARLKALVEKR
ncbi:activator of HSP90 ATPase [Rhizorhabdus wittichii DC-6]|nr:activator of HSP90 ATPase [Rhizorhabdus wittichii DC-6]